MPKWLPPNRSPLEPSATGLVFQRRYRGGYSIVSQYATPRSEMVGLHVLYCDFPLGRQPVGGHPGDQALAPGSTARYQTTPRSFAVHHLLLAHTSRHNSHITKLTPGYSSPPGSRGRGSPLGRSHLAGSGKRPPLARPRSESPPRGRMRRHFGADSGPLRGSLTPSGRPGTYSGRTTPVTARRRYWPRAPGCTRQRPSPSRNR